MTVYNLYQIINNLYGFVDLFLCFNIYHLLKIVSVISIYEVIQGYRQFQKTQFSAKDLNTKRILSSQRRTYLLVILTLVFGIEIGFKLQSKQVRTKQNHFS